MWLKHHFGELRVHRDEMVKGNYGINQLELWFKVVRRHWSRHHRTTREGMTLPCGSVMTRSVWSYNLKSEFEFIRFVIALYSFIFMDMEFLGVVFQSHPTFWQPQNNYALMKANLDCMHLIQVGLTISDDLDNLPTFGTSNYFICEFNFCEFDVTFAKVWGVRFVELIMLS